jgi:hypothetical protein
MRPAIGLQETFRVISTQKQMHNVLLSSMNGLALPHLVVGGNPLCSGQQLCPYQCWTIATDPDTRARVTPDCSYNHLYM